MVLTWGGPDIVSQAMGTQAGSLSDDVRKSKLEGFDRFMMTRFSPLCWAIPSNPNFDAKDAQGRQVLIEAAALQKGIYQKCGQDYSDYLRTIELSGMGMSSQNVDDYLNALANMELRAFQQYFKVDLTCIRLILDKSLIHSRILYKGPRDDTDSSFRLQYLASNAFKAQIAFWVLQDSIR